MKLVRLMTCDNAFQAHTIRGALENEGIASMLSNEYMSNVMRGYVSSITGVSLLVDEADYDKAVAMLEQNQMIPEQLRYCPHCGSPEIKFVLKKGNRLRTMLAVVATILAGTPPGSNHWEYICKGCGEHFEKPVSTSRPDHSPVGSGGELE